MTVLLKLGLVGVDMSLHIFRGNRMYWLVDMLPNTAERIQTWLTAAALAFAYTQIRANRRLSRESSALTAYREYLKLCLEHPNLSSWTLFAREHEGIKPAAIKDVLNSESERYLWFLSILLETCEGMLNDVPDSDHWRLALANQLKYHRKALEVLWREWRETYSKPMQTFVDEVLAANKNR
jgi:hypothetical protein